MFFTKVFNMLFARSGSDSKAAPIPPFKEKSFGQPWNFDRKLVCFPIPYYNLTYHIDVNSCYIILYHFGDIQRTFSIGCPKLENHIFFFDCTSSEYNRAIHFVDEINCAKHLCINHMRKVRLNHGEMLIEHRKTNHLHVDMTSEIWSQLFPPNKQCEHHNVRLVNASIMFQHEP